MSNQGSVLLLGSGYTLSRLANDLPKESLILTSTKLEKVEAFRSQGFVAEQVDVKDRGSLNSLFSTHPDITLAGSFAYTWFAINTKVKISKIGNNKLLMQLKVFIVIYNKCLIRYF